MAEAADSTIKGFLYQFNKSLFEILECDNQDIVTVEGMIEDIDILNDDKITAIQCKYHESSSFSISNLMNPFLELFVEYCKNREIGRNVKYILYEYFPDNDSLLLDNIKNSIGKTENKDTILKYLSKLYKISDLSVLNLIEKPKKTQNDKNIIINYILNNRNNLEFKYKIEDFWDNFEYVQADKFEDLKNSVIEKMGCIFPKDEVEYLYYPNAISMIAEVSSNSDEKQRQIIKSNFFTELEKKKTFIYTKWACRAINRKSFLRLKQKELKDIMNINSYVRVIVFSDNFLKNIQDDDLMQFIVQYIDKFNKKPKLNKQPIFVFEEDCGWKRMKSVAKTLSQKNIYVKSSLVFDSFDERIFLNNEEDKDKPASFINIDCFIDVMSKFRYDCLFSIGQQEKIKKCDSIDIKNIQELKYIFNISDCLPEGL